MVCIKLNTLLAACPSGRYGIECVNRCDTYCSGNESCDPVIGLCTTGCKQGYKGCGLGNVTNYTLQKLDKKACVITQCHIKF